MPSQLTRLVTQTIVKRIGDVVGLSMWFEEYVEADNGGKVALMLI